MNIKKKLICKIACLTRKKRLFRLDSFLRLIYNPNKKRKYPINTVLNLDDYLINVNTSSYLEWYLFFYACYEPMVQTIIKKTIKPGAVCLDIGANVGIHTLLLAKCTGQAGLVYAFEPHPTIFSRLSSNIALNNFFWVTPCKCAISSKTGTGILQSFNSDISNQGMSYLSKDTKVNNETSFETRITSVDEFIKNEKITRLDFFKVDVEGHEAAVFQGAEKTIQKYKPLIIFENNRNHPNETKNLIAYLSSLSYEFYDVRFNHLKRYIPSNNINELTGSNIFAVNTITLNNGE